MSEKKNIATRDGFGHEIVALGKENPDLLVVDIDIGKSCPGSISTWALPSKTAPVWPRALPPAGRSPSW